MPYIKANSRKWLDQWVDALVNAVGGAAKHTEMDKAGLLNYAITTLIKKVYGSNMRYADHNEIIGMLECVKQEWYRRQVAPYEDGKIEENGDV